MRNILMCAMLALAFITAAAVSAQDDPLQRQILAKERQELERLKTGDYAQFGSLLADDAVFVDAQGAAKKSTVIEHTFGCRLQDYTIQDPKFVRVSGNSGLLSYTITETGTSHGRPFSIKVYVSALWAKRNGKWLCLFSQETAAHAPR